MKNQVIGLVALSFLLACGSDPPPPAAPPPAPAPTPVASASVATAPVEKPVEKPVEVFNFGKKAPAAGAKLTDKYTSEVKEEKRAEERKIEVVTSEDKTITKAKVTLVSFDHTLKGKTTQPNKALQGKTLTVEVGKDGKAAVTDDQGKADNKVAKFVAMRRPPRIGEPLPGVLAFGERGLKVGDTVEGEGLAKVVAELGEWRDESVPIPASAKHELTAKGVLKSVDNGTAMFEVTAKEKTSEGTQFALEIEYTGTIAVHMSDSLVSKANLTSKGSIKMKDMPAPGGKKISMDVPLEATISFQRAWE